MSREFFCKNSRDIKKIFSEAGLQDFKIIIDANNHATVYFNYGEEKDKSVENQIKIKNKIRKLCNVAQTNAVINFMSAALIEELHAGEDNIPLNYDDFLGENLLLSAIEGDKDFISEMLKGTVNIDYQEMKFKQTALHLCLRQLVSLRANFNKSDAEREKNTLKKMKQLLDTMELLLSKNININLINNSGQNAIVAAIDWLPQKVSLSIETNENTLEAEKLIGSAFSMLEKKGAIINKEALFVKGYSFGLSAEKNLPKNLSEEPVKNYHGFFRPEREEPKNNINIKNEKIKFLEKMDEFLDKCSFNDFIQFTNNIETIMMKYKYNSTMNI